MWKDMAVSKQRPIIFGFASVGIIIITLTYLLYFRRPNTASIEHILKASVLWDFNIDSHSKGEEDSSVSSQQKHKVVLTMDQDWGNVTCPVSDLSKEDQNLHDYITNLTLPCIFKVSVGGSFKGPYFYGEKWMCLDKKFDIRHGNCTVLSFGISNDWTFDDEIDRLFGCKVYAFDPTIGRKDHNRSNNIRFFNLGISDGPGLLGNGKRDRVAGFNVNIKEAKSILHNQEKVERYSTILKMLHLENSVIDYLKIDVENSEYKFFKDVLSKTPNLLKNVKQIGMEIHLPGYETVAWRYLQRLDCLGFKVMSYGFNPTLPVTTVNGRQRGPLYEIVWGQDRNW